ncbi:class I adenylate-forming enzyme family protein [Pseudorhodoplanes sinuspersici]|uniref:AMP-dependent synthetase n=1 Tax=Pseudorhodoplanes sinuspersici TaxID=1235591 RepID=A0A1W6ZYZ7_9HYPH|nr:class I adenylate-forming enzyme family protein [Pseudorhodoplanes sinuspersici]ARQ02629.1 AMP-dependent synthetase [Pseudorhodoplanes sinuspersici]RKE74495.1 acyl-CoA synthetase (AMP-forming)/AMP-acid ligase II [Pseudorhodoplanes sinuspersici]
MLMHQLLLDNAERQPSKIALRWVDRDMALTNTQAVAAMERFAGALHHLGVTKGDRVTIFAHNGMDYLICMLACWRIGAIAALVNVKFADQLPYYFADHTPSVVIYTHDMGEPVRAAAAHAPSVKHLVCMDGPQEKAHSLPELLAANFASPPDPWDEGAIAHLSYTSGTTGQPKGACLCHEPTVRASRCIGERLRITGDDISFGPSALSSSYQLVGNLLPPLAVGATINVMGRWTQSTGYAAIDRLGATFLVGNPPLLEEVLTESRLKGRAPGNLRFSLSGGGPVPPTLKMAWRDELKIPLVESYGQSELGGFVGLGFPDLEMDDDKLQRVGPALPDKEVRVFGPEDKPLPVGEVGDIVLRGGFMWGYWGKPEKTKEARRGGWLRTGDLGVFDDDGYLTMRSRRAELIEVAGTAWYPRDVEEALCRVQGVRQAALVGIPDPVLGARPTAFVTLHSDAKADRIALKKAITGQVPYDLEALVVNVVAELPMTPTGKIAKSELASLAVSGRLVA